MNSIPNPLIIASRGSTLALWQAHYAKSIFESETQKVEIQVIKTTGDKVQDRFLHEIGGKGLFIKELEQALLDKSAHLAVHSLKDLPAHIPAGFKLASVHKRHQPTDILIFNPKTVKNFQLPDGDVTAETFKSFGKFVVATGSLRRTSLLKSASPAVEVIPIRGNVDTRIQKLLDGDWDGLILAEASLERLGIQSNYITRRLDSHWFVPSAAQGALAIETLDNTVLDKLLEKFTCKQTTLCVNLERSILAKLGGDCTMPFGCHFYQKNNHLVGDVIILDNAGNSVSTQNITPFDINANVDTITDHLLQDLIGKGAEKILKNLGIVAPFMEG